MSIRPLIICLALISPSLQADLQSHQLIGIFKLGFIVENIDAAFVHMEQSGADVFFPPVTASDGRTTFGIKDPEGNIIQFFSQKP